MSVRANIVGNGKSREDMNLVHIAKKGPIYGCNALYRDFMGYKKLIVMDDGMKEEINRKNIPRAEFIQGAELFEPIEYKPWMRRNNTGVLAMKKAIKDGYNNLYLYGMDFLFDDRSFVMSNIYEGTENYTQDTMARYVDTYNRYLYFLWFVEKNKDIDFTVVLPYAGTVLKELPSSIRTEIYYEKDYLYGKQA